MSGSKGFIRCVRLWTMVTSIPSSRRFSASSTLMKPPPASTADRGRCRLMYSLMRRVSSTVRRVNSLRMPMPGSRG